jgi:periplasmic divalent cation tolerance protein
MATEILMVYCTCPDQEAGTELATLLVERGLAGCINILPGITSIYKWHGEMKSGTEVLLLIKCPADKYPELQRTILEQHPYELPEIIAVSLKTGLPAYLNWIRDETSI